MTGLEGETANIAVNASLTGHLVLSTLHTNGAAGVIPRLIDLGVSPQILAAALSVSLAQRLVRKVCEHCKYEIEPTEKQEKIIRDILEEAVSNNKNLSDYGLSLDQKITLTEGRGCEKCNGIGYKGRIGIFEAIITDEYIEELLNKTPSEQEVRKVAEKQGLLNMREDGIIKILNGITSFAEVKAVVDLEIKNITQLDEPKPIPKPENHIPIVQTESVNPHSLLGSDSVELSLLIDYMRSLEHEQIINPEIDVSEKIALLQHTILDLLKEKEAEKIFSETDNSKTHKKFTAISNELEKIYHEQQQNPNIDMSHRLKNVREDIEHNH